MQGVGFRAWSRTRARAHGLAGSARNLPDGRVEVIAEGPRRACERLLADVQSSTAPGTVREVGVRWQDVEGLSGFWIG